MPSHIRERCLGDPKQGDASDPIELGFHKIRLKPAPDSGMSLNSCANDCRVFTRPSSSNTPGRNSIAIRFTDRIMVVTRAESDLSFCLHRPLLGVTF